MKGEVLGSVVQSEPVDWCHSKLQPHLSLPLIVNSVLNQAWFGMLSCQDGLLNPFVALVPECVMIYTMLHYRIVRPDILGWRTGPDPSLACCAWEGGATEHGIRAPG